MLERMLDVRQQNHKKHTIPSGGIVCFLKPIDKKRAIITIKL